MGGLGGFNATQRSEIVPNARKEAKFPFDFWLAKALLRAGFLGLAEYHGFYSLPEKQGFQLESHDRPEQTWLCPAFLAISGIFSGNRIPVLGVIPLQAEN